MLGSQLRADAELEFINDESSDEEDNIPLIHLAKILRNEEALEACSSNLSDVSETNMPTVPKNQQYTWRNRHNPKNFPEWQDVQNPNNLQSPLFYFDTMFDDNVIQLLVQYTNTYASQKNKIGNVSTSEMKCFLAILLYSGYVVVPRRSMYWEKSSDTNFDLVNNAMSRDRFNFIMAHIHCCDNTLIQGNSDKFSKLRPLFDLLNKNFIDMAPLEEKYSVDEAMVPYYGGHSCKQFIRGKPIRWGYKFWVGATRLGYILWFDPYQGQSAMIPSAYKQFGLGGSVILRFADILQKREPTLHFHLFFDNFFTSIPLIHELSNRGLKATGTIRENRTSKCPLPTNNDFKKTERGTYKSKSSRPENILVCKWNDNSVVTVASNIDKVEPVQTARRFSQQHKRYVQINQPNVIKNYNANMGGVDRVDQNIGLYRTSIRGKKWYFPLIAHSLDMATQNAWQVYRYNGGDQDHLNFRRAVVRSLLETYKRTETRGPCPTPRTHRETSRFDRVDHIVAYKDAQLICKVCKKKTNFICQKCELHLHPKFCFVAFHTPGN